MGSLGLAASQQLADAPLRPACDPARPAGPERRFPSRYKIGDGVRPAYVRWSERLVTGSAMLLSAGDEGADIP
jgi:hypothetical protein